MSAATATAAEPKSETKPEQTNGQTKALEQKPPARITVRDDSEFGNLLDTAKFEHLYRVATVYAGSKIVPAHYQGSIPDCFIATQMAIRLGIDPMMFMQNTYIVQGKPGMEAKLAIALVNTRGPFRGPIQWKMDGEGPTRRATAFGVHKDTGEICECTVSMEVAKLEGWIDKNGSKWRTMPEQMLRYRSAMWLARLYAPECLMGMSTVDELEDMAPPAKHVINTAIGSMATAKEAVRLASGRQEPEAAPASEEAEDPKPEATTPGREDIHAGIKETPKDAERKAEIKQQVEASKKAPVISCKPGKKGCAPEGSVIKINGKDTYCCAEHAPRD
jgi:hypothetical protein